jgi:hypothetical protein
LGCHPENRSWGFGSWKSCQDFQHWIAMIAQWWAMMGTYQMSDVCYSINHSW